MNLLASLYSAGTRSSRGSTLQPMSTRNQAIPIRRASRCGLLITLIGLSALLLIPLLARHQAEMGRERIEFEIEPAREQIDRTLLLAYEARGDRNLFPLLSEDVPTSPPDRSLFPSEDFLRRWKAEIDDDHVLRACGGATWQNWQRGKHLLNQWMRASRQADAASTRSSFATRTRVDLLFTQGTQALQQARRDTFTSQYAIRKRLGAIGRIEIALTVPMVLLCLLLAIAAWKTQVRLRRFWRRERAITLQLKEANHRLEMLATTDGLTDLKNHRAFQEWLEGAFRLTVRQDRPLSLLLLDVDRFKQVNDRYGHPTGDEILKQVAEILATTCRSSDTAARYGGEEFAVILPDTDQTGAMLLAERFRTRIADAPWALTAITISIGVATRTWNTFSQAELIAEADGALYVSKQEGRNRVTHFEEAFQNGGWEPIPHNADTHPVEMI